MQIKYVYDTLQKLTNTKISYETFGKIIGVRGSAIGNRLARGYDMPLDEIIKLEKHFCVKLQDDVEFYPTQNEELVSIDYYPEVFGSCGSGCFVLSEEKEKINLPKRLINTYSKIKSYSVINAYGDSMQPSIYDKDKLIIEFNDGEQIVDNRVYVFRFGDSIFIKRLSLNINQLVIKSDNTDYDTITLDVASADIQIIGKVVGLIRNME